jgi:hypothetical protein
MNKDHVFTLKMTQKERAALDSISKVEGMKPSEVMRNFIREGLAARGLPPVGNHIPNGTHENQRQAA